MLADASRILHDTSTEGASGDAPAPKTPVGKRSREVERYIRTADTRKMTLTEYKQFLELQRE